MGNGTRLVGKDLLIVPQIVFRNCHRKMAVSPEANTNVSSLTNRSRSRRTIVPSSSTSSVRSIPEPLQTTGNAACDLNHNVAVSGRGRDIRCRVPPSRPGDFHPEALTEPCVTVSRHTARAIH
jgi:hypothetical protein